VGSGGLALTLAFERVQIGFYATMIFRTQKGYSALTYDCTGRKGGGSE
jgi:hypothetical protein